MGDLALRQTRSGTCNASGQCTLLIGPGACNESWNVQRISVFNDSDTTLSRTSPIIANVYRNCVSPAQVLGGTYNGTGDTDSGESIDLSPVENLVVQWTGADASSGCVVTVEGTMTLRGSRIY